MLSTEDFDFDLPEELIAQTPLKDRASSRLLVIKKQGTWRINISMIFLMNYSLGMH